MSNKIEIHITKQSDDLYLMTFNDEDWELGGTMGDILEHIQSELELIGTEDLPVIE